MADYELLVKPLTKQQVLERMDSEGRIRGVVAVDLSDVIEGNLESFLDNLSTALVGTDLLMDIWYRVVGFDNDTLHIEVEGDPAMIIEVEGNE